MYRTFHGKVLLFGEYTIFTGSQALVTPLKRFSGTFELPGENMRKKPVLADSNRELRRFFDYLSQDIVDAKRYSGNVPSEILPLELDLGRMGRELEKGLCFHSSIPREYGAGSSAALVAAVYDAFAENRIMPSTVNSEELAALRKVMGRMESLFHGTSSGIDPVCCYTGRTILLEGTAVHASTIPRLPDNCKFFLLDAGLKGETGPLVQYFKQRLDTDNAFREIIANILTPLVGDCIRNLLAGSLSGLSASFKELSACQLLNLEKMIPGRISEIWDLGMRTGSFALKLCGSGGGGYFLGFSEKWATALDGLRNTPLRILPLDL